MILGIVVKMHESRLLQENRKLARENLISKLDVLYNGENSVNAQKEKIMIKKNQEQSRKTAKRNDMKKKWREREGIT